MDMRQFQPDRGSGEPMFRQLAAFIRSSIDSGALMLGERLPPERAFSANLGMARGTVRSAFALLEAEGIIVSRRGSGSYVARVPRTAAGANREAAALAVNQAIDTMAGLGMTDEEMSSLFVRCLAARRAEK